MATLIDGVRVAVTVAESVSVTAGPLGGVPLAVAVLRIEPAFIFANVTVYVAVQFIVPVGFNVVCGHETADKPGSGSVTAIPVSVTLPVFDTKNE